jgi:hypothetical protein
MAIPHTAVWGWFKSFLRRISFSPPARSRAEFNLESRGRKDLNDPHTAVWGIASCRLLLPLLLLDHNLTFNTTGSFNFSSGARWPASSIDPH